MSGNEGQLKGDAVSNEKDAAEDEVHGDTNPNQKALVITNDAQATLSPGGEHGTGEHLLASSNDTVGVVPNHHKNSNETSE